MNKKTIITILLTIISMTTFAQIKVEVSETVELMSILARTAGYEEYSKDLAGQYTKDTEAWFAPYKQHATVALCKDIRSKYGIGYDRVMNMAVHLDIEKGKVKFIGNRSELNNGWKDVDLDDFLKKLNKFYVDTRFHEFFEQHLPFYEQFTKAYGVNVMPYLHPEWFSRFHYGTEPTEQFRVIINFTYGDNNNGISCQLPGQSREVFAIMGYWIDPAMGRPRYDHSLLLHEMNHSFINPLLDDATNAQLMEDVGKKLLQRSQSLMAQQHYSDWHIVINESLVRAAVIICMQDVGSKQDQMLNVLASEMMQKGFPWMLDLVGTMRYYTAHRDQYKTLNDFYPEIVRCLEQYVKDVERRK